MKLSDINEIDDPKFDPEMEMMRQIINKLIEVSNSLQQEYHDKPDDEIYQWMALEAIKIAAIVRERDKLENDYRVVPT